MKAGSEFLYHGSRLSEVDQEALRHFASGVFWKASVREWHTPVGGITLQTRLGPIYEEAFRQYLAGEGPFPQNARLMIWLCGELDPPVLVVFPDTERGHSHHSYRFFVPGLCFYMVAGRLLPPDVLAIWGTDPTEIPILVHYIRSEGIHEDVFEVFGNRTRAVARKFWGSAQ